MNALFSLFEAITVILLISLGIGFAIGGPEKANKIFSWELKQLAKTGRWVLKHLFQAIANLFSSLAKACGPKKKTKKP
jgi:hypothetical protein